MANNKKRFTIPQIAAALRKHDGLVARAAEELKGDRRTIHDRIDRSPELQEVMREIEDSHKTLARGAITEALRNKDMATVRWYAERKMRDEGYGTKIENSIDTAQLERLAEAIAAGGIATLRAVAAALAGPRP